MTTETLYGFAYAAELDHSRQSLTIRLRVDGQAMAQVNGHLLPPHCHGREQ